MEGSWGDGLSSYGRSSRRDEHSDGPYVSNAFCPGRMHCWPARRQRPLPLTHPPPCPNLGSGPRRRCDLSDPRQYAFNQAGKGVDGYRQLPFQYHQHAHPWYVYVRRRQRRYASGWAGGSVMLALLCSTGGVVLSVALQGITGAVMCARGSRLEGRVLDCMAIAAWCDVISSVRCPCRQPPSAALDSPM